jgi:hypothetical protein
MTFDQQTKMTKRGLTVSSPSKSKKAKINTVSPDDNDTGTQFNQYQKKELEIVDQTLQLSRPEEPPIITRGGWSVQEGKNFIFIIQAILFKKIFH